MKQERTVKQKGYVKYLNSPKTIVVTLCDICSAEKAKACQKCGYDFCFSHMPLHLCLSREAVIKSA